MAKKRRSKGRRKRSRPPKVGPAKAPLTLSQMLKRIPDKEWLDTPEVQHVFNDCHVMTIYKKVQKGVLRSYRRASSGKASLYKRDNVEAAVRARFAPRPTRSGGAA